MTGPMKPSDIITWQYRLAAKQKVYAVCICDGDIDTTGNLYDSREAAQFEVDFCRAHGEKRARVCCLGNLHSAELSRERWWQL